MASSFGQMVVLFDRTGRPEIAATLYGAATNNPLADLNVGLAEAVDHVRSVLNADTFDTCVRAGAAMTITEAVHYARHHIDNAR